LHFLPSISTTNISPVFLCGSVEVADNDFKCCTSQEIYFDWWKNFSGGSEPAPVSLGKLNIKF
jgi:hypothetical protein